MIRLINSAMTPAPRFTYMYESLSAEGFFDIIKNNEVDSYIGYQPNLDLIEEKTGVALQLCTDQTPVEEGDILLIMKLRYRTRTKGAPVKFEDFEFGITFVKRTFSMAKRMMKDDIHKLIEGKEVK